VLVVGGEVLGGGTLASAELYDPATGSWSPAASMSVPRWLPGATRLADGRVLVAGGDGGASAELYSPATDTWTPAGSMGVAHGYRPLQALLLDGRVLVAGGLGPNGDVASAELFTP
jgi:hypothetical protein